MTLIKKLQYAFLACLIVPLLFSFKDGEKKLRIFLIGDSTIAIKDTDRYPETGWGMPFQYFFGQNTAIFNTAKNGRSTRTFIEEKRWQAVYDSLQAGDYVIIQFGHNDAAVDKKDRYTPPEDYRTNLIKFVNEARSKKAIPIILTPVARRKFNKEGHVEESHPVYADIAREVAKSENTLFIDLDKSSMELLEQFGPENSKLLYNQIKPEINPNYPDGIDDNTHFNEMGARLIAQLVWQDLKKICPDMNQYSNEQTRRKAK